MGRIGVKYQDKYEISIKEILQQVQIPQNFIELNIEGVNYNDIKEYTDIIGGVLYKYKTILETFIFGNSFVGNEYFILRYTTHQIILYWLILGNEHLSKEDENTCILEIETQYYFYLNCIYNILEKFKAFVAYHNKDKKLNDGSLLNSNAADTILEIFRNKYRLLKNYNEARGFIVHNTFSIEYINSLSRINVSCFSFRLTNKKVVDDEKKLRSFSFDINTTTLIEPIIVIHDLILESLSVFKQVSNLDLRKLIEKFINTTNGKNTFSMSF